MVPIATMISSASSQRYASMSPYCRPVSCGPQVHGLGQRGGHRRVVGALPDPALHVAVLVLDDAGHERRVRVEQAVDPFARIAHERAQQLVLGELDILERVGGEEPVLDDEERRVRLLGDAPGDGS